MTQNSLHHRRKRDCAELLAELKSALETLDPELVGPSVLREDEIAFRDGKATLTVEFPPTEDEAHSAVLHAHVTVRWKKDEFVTETCSACVVATRSDGARPFAPLAGQWLTLVAPVVFSVLLGKSVLGAKRFTGREPWSVSRREGYVGPMETRIFSSENHEELHSYLRAIAEGPVFVNATELAGDRRLHIAKVSLMFDGKTWERSLEIDDHSAGLSQAIWDPEIEWRANFSERTPEHAEGNPVDQARPQAFLSGFAAFFGGASYTAETTVMTDVEKIDAALETLVEGFLGENPPPFDLDVFHELGIDASLAEELNNFVPLAFGRECLDAMHVAYRDTYSVVFADGTYRKNLPIAENRFFSRARRLTPGYCYSPKYHAAFKHIAFSSPEIQAINNAMKHGSDLKRIVLSAPVTVEGGIDPEVFEKSYKEIMLDTTSGPGYTDGD